LLYFYFWTYFTSIFRVIVCWNGRSPSLLSSVGSHLRAARPPYVKFLKDRRVAGPKLLPLPECMAFFLLYYWLKLFIIGVQEIWNISRGGGEQLFAIQEYYSSSHIKGGTHHDNHIQFCFYASGEVVLEYLKKIWARWNSMIREKQCKEQIWCFPIVSPRGISWLLSYIGNRSNSLFKKFASWSCLGFHVVMVIIKSFFQSEDALV
jgi:hypothetical protein